MFNSIKLKHKLNQNVVVMLLLFFSLAKSLPLLTEEEESICVTLPPTASSIQVYLKLGQPETQIVSTGQDITLNCPFAKAMWHHNGKWLNTSHSLVIKKLTENDSGLYSCLSQKAELLGVKWANITLKICNNSKAPDNPWDDIADIRKIAPESISPSSEFTSLEKTEYIVKESPVSLKQKSSNSSTNSSHSNLELVKLNENAAGPKFKNQLYQYLDKQAGGLLFLNCAPIGNLTPNITWKYNDSQDVTNSFRIKLKKWTLSIQDLKVEDSGKYTCEICNSQACISHSTYVRVNARIRTGPVIVNSEHLNKTVYEHDNAHFECQVRSELEPFIIWLKHDYDNLNLTDSVAFDTGLNLNAKMLTTRKDEPHLLSLGDVGKEDEGWYTCIAANALGRAAFSTYLLVLKPSEKTENTADTQKESVTSTTFNSLNLEQPDLDDNIEHDVDSDITNKNSEEFAPQFRKISKLVKRLHKPSGTSLQLMCPAIGNPMPNITWTRNNTKIERDIGAVTYKKWSIQMDDAITKDSGVYKCSVCNIHGCIEHSTNITIFDRLRSRPIISDKFPQNQTVLVNTTTYVECRVVSDLEPYIVWLKYSRKNDSISELEKTVPNFSNENRSITTDVIILPRDPDKPNILNFSKITHEDEGWYTCVAASSLGQTVASAYIKVVDKLPRDMLQRAHPMWLTSATIGAVLLFLFGTVVVVIYFLRNLKHEKLLKQRIETVHQWTKKVIIYKPPPSEGSSCDLQMPVIKIEKQRTTFTKSSNSDPNQAFNEYEFPLDSNWEIPRSQLALGSTLGEGAFGRVVMAQASSLPRQTSNNSANGLETIVAVKMVKEEHTDADMASLVREMEVMKMIGKHINIINLLGCCTQGGPLWVIVEYAPHGNLKDFLKQNRPLSGWGSTSLHRHQQQHQQQRNSDYLEEKPDLTEKLLISFSFQIARGMEYLASRRCIHRDLAARNVLVSDDYVMKIADFGLARDIQDTDYYRKNTNGRLPIKWMAPESLQEKFYDSQSDVWSYGVLLWEIMTFGEQPYPNIMSAEELYSYLITGQRMEKPSRCSLNIYMLMRQCWHFDSQARPTFAEIVENLDKILQLSSSSSNEEYLDLSVPMLETPPSSSDENETDDDDDGGGRFIETKPLNRYQYTYKFN